MRFWKLAAVASLATALYGTGSVVHSEKAYAEYPEKPIKLIIPFRAGGGSDSLARTMQAAIEKHDLLPVPLVITNIDGAAGAIAARRVRDSKPDGYTFLQIHNGIFATAATEKLGFPLSELKPVAMTTQSCIYIAVPSSQPWQTFDELVADAKANPGKFKASDNIGGITHFSWLQIMQATGIDVGMVQAGGTAKRFAQMKGGHTHMALMSPGWIQRGGDELRGLLWMGPERDPAAPDMPTAKEKGIDVVSCLNRRFWTAKDTPQEAVDYFANLLKKVMATEEMKAYHKKTGSNIVIQTGAELEQAIKDELAGFREVAPMVMKAMGNK